MSEKLARDLAERLEKTGIPQKADSRMSAESAELEHLAAIAEKIREVRHPAVSEAFRRNARVRILNQVTTYASPDAPAPQPIELKLRLTLALRNVLFATAILVGFLFTGELVSFSAQNALPGDMLYPVKIGLETTRELLASSEDAAILHTRYASNRLTEIQLLIVARRYDDITPAVAAFEHNVDQAVTALTEVARQDSPSTYPILVRMEKDLHLYSETLQDLLTVVPSDTRVVLARAITASQTLSLPVD